MPSPSRPRASALIVGEMMHHHRGTEGIFQTPGRRWGRRSPGSAWVRCHREGFLEAGATVSSDEEVLSAQIGGRGGRGRWRGQHDPETGSVVREGGGGLRRAGGRLDHVGPGQAGRSLGATVFHRGGALSQGQVWRMSQGRPHRRGDTVYVGPIFLPPSVLPSNKHCSRC